MKTLCVTGGNGLLGTKICELALHDYRIVSIDCQENPATQHKNLIYIRDDITRKASIYDSITCHKPDFIIHTAAMTNVDGCETESEKAWEINVGGTENVAVAARELGIKMIHLSTDYVFDGENGPYSEEDEVHPISVYGSTKLESERIIQNLLNNFVIARTMVLYGYASGVRLNYITWLIDVLGKGEAVTIVTDQYGTPTLADDLAKALLILYKKNGQGIYHTAGSELINRFDMAIRVADVFGFDVSLIQPTTSDTLDQPAPRPLRSGLKIEKVKNEFKIHFYSVFEGLKLIQNQMRSKK